MKTTVIQLGAIGAIAAILRLFTRQIFERLGIPTIVGSLLASISIVLVVGMSLIFAREGKKADGRYWRAAGWFFVLALWCELLIIGGILTTESLHLNSYYTGPWEMVRHQFPRLRVTPLDTRRDSGFGPHF